MTENILNPKLPLLNLDVQKQQEWAAPAQLMTQGDKGYIQPFTLSQNWTKYQVDTTELGLRFSKPDGNIYDSGVTTSSLVTETGLTSAGFKTYEIELPKELTQVPGTVTAYIYATNSAGTIVASSNRFTYQVLPEFSADPASTTYIKGLDEIRDQLDDYLNKIKTLSDSYGADKDAIVANLKKQAQQWLSQEQDELSNQLTAEQQKLSDLSQKYTDKYNELIKQLPNADDAITQKINKELADIQKQAQDALKGLDLSNYELKSDLAEKLSAINTSLEKAISIDDVNKALASYATKADLDKKADKAELASYATKDELKAIQPVAPDLSGYETKADHANDINSVRDALANKANTSDLVTYETKTDAKKALDTKANASDLANYATKDDLKTIQPGAPDLSGYETTSAHQKDIDGINEALKGKADVASLSDLATKAEIANVRNDLSNYTTKDALTAYETKADAKKSLDAKANTSDLAGYATKDELAAKADKASLAGYATKTDLDTKADNTALDAKANVSDLATYETKSDAKKALDAKANVTDLAAYATKDDLKNIKPDVPDLSSYEKVADHKKDIDGINDALKGKADVASLSNLATKDEVANKADRTDIPDTSQFIKQIGVNGNSYTPSYDGTIDLPDYPDTSKLATKDDLNTKADKTELAGYATKTDLDTKANVSDLATYETKADAKTALDAKANASDLATYATKDDLKAKADTTALAGYATKDDLKKVKPAETDLSSYETKADHKKDIDGINKSLSNKVDKTTYASLDGIVSNIDYRTDGVGWASPSYRGGGGNDADLLHANLMLAYPYAYSIDRLKYEAKSVASNLKNNDSRPYTNSTFTVGKQWAVNPTSIGDDGEYVVAGINCLSQQPERVLLGSNGNISYETSKNYAVMINATPIKTVNENAITQDELNDILKQINIDVKKRFGNRLLSIKYPYTSADIPQTYCQLVNQYQVYGMRPMQGYERLVEANQPKYHNFFQFPLFEYYFNAAINSRVPIIKKYGVFLDDQVCLNASDANDLSRVMINSYGMPTTVMLNTTKAYPLVYFAVSLDDISE